MKQHSSDICECSIQLTAHCRRTLQAVVQGYAASGFPAPTFRSALATALAVDSRYVAIVAVANQPARRHHADHGGGRGLKAATQAVRVDSVIAAISAAAAVRLVAIARSAAPALTAELRRLGLVNADVTSITASVQSTAPTQPPSSDAAANAVFGGLGVLGLGLIVGLCGLLIFAATACLCCCRRSQSLKVAPTPPYEDVVGLESPPASGQGLEAVVASAGGAGGTGDEIEGDAPRRRSSWFRSPVRLVRNESSDGRASPKNRRVDLPPVRPPAGWATPVQAGVHQRPPA
jgi:hypothetical protein